MVSNGFSRSGKLLDEWPLFGVVNIRWHHDREPTLCEWRIKAGIVYCIYANVTFAY